MNALAGSPARERREWRAAGVAVDEVARELDRLAGEHFRHPRGHATTRTLNLVVSPVEPELEPTVAERLATLRGRHPARTLVLREHGDDRLDAEVVVECAVDAPGEAGACHDRGILTASRARLEHADSIVRPLLVEGLRTAVWVPGGGEGPACAPLVALADVVVLDSASAECRDSLARSARLARGAASVHDLAWGRLDRWRARIAAAFAAPERIALLGRVEMLLVRYGGAASDALLLAGWICARAGWRLERIAGDAAGWHGYCRRAGRGAIELLLEAEDGARGPGGVVHVSFCAGSDAVDLHRGAVIEHPSDEFLDALGLTDDFTRGFAPALAAAGTALGAL